MGWSFFTSLSVFVPNIFWRTELNICLFVTETGDNCQSVNNPGLPELFINNVDMKDIFSKLYIVNNPGNKEVFAIFQRFLYYPLLSLDKEKD
jgi:hypothetical protein